MPPPPHPTLTFKGKGRVKPAPEGRSPLKSGASRWWGQACSTLGLQPSPRLQPHHASYLGPVSQKKKRRRNPTSLTFTTQRESNHLPGLPPRSASPPVDHEAAGLPAPLPAARPQPQPEGPRVSPAPTSLRVGLQSPGPSLLAVRTRPGLPSPRRPPLCPQAAPSMALVRWSAHPQKPALSGSGSDAAFSERPVRHAPFPTPALQFPHCPYHLPTHH